METTLEMYDGEVYGFKVSQYGRDHGYLDYRTLANIIGECMLNNTIRSATHTDWEIVAGEFDQQVMSDYIISAEGYRFLRDFTDELVFYNEKLDIYVWAITHYGTRWDYVLTNVKLEEMRKNA
jgi:hypothetical protein